MTGDWERLAGFAARRRAELGLTQQEVAQRGPLSLDRVQAIEGAKRDSYRLGTLLALERALDWAKGSVENILGGGEPDPRHRTFDGDKTPTTDEVQRYFRVEDIPSGDAFRKVVMPRQMNVKLPALKGDFTAEVEVDFGIGDTLPYPDPRDEVEQEANETWQAAKNLERIMRRQRQRAWEQLRRRDIDETG